MRLGKVITTHVMLAGTLTSD